MVGTVGAARRDGARFAFAQASVAHAAGLLVGAAALFAALGALGALLPDGRGRLVATAALCALAAVLDAAGRRVRPQIPFQVPERWRRMLPLPLAVFLYGCWLGTGVASAVPAVAFWALLGATVALGSLQTALVVAAALAVGRAVPVLVLARVPHVELGERVVPLRAVRLLAACVLAVAAAAATAQTATAADRVGGIAFDPSAAGTDVAWSGPNNVGYLRRADGSVTKLPGGSPAIGDTLIAWRNGSTVTVAERESLTPLFSEPIVGVRQLAISQRWLVLRVVTAGGVQKLIAQSIGNTNVHRVIAAAKAPEQLGRPSISGDTVVFPLASRGRTSIVAVPATGGPRRTLRTATATQVLAPSLAGARLLYVQTDRCTQRLLLGGVVGTTGSTLLAQSANAGQDAGHAHGYTTQGEHTPCPPGFKPASTILWTTAIGSDRAYVTMLRPRKDGTTEPTIVAVRR